MFGDIGWTELVVIGIVALIVIGPEDLPDMFRQIGRFTAKLRQMSREFSRAMEQAAKDSGVKDVASDLKAVTSAKSLGLNAVKGAVDKFEKWDPLKPTAPAPAAKVLVPAPMTATPDAVAAAAATPEPTIAAPPVVPVGPATQALFEKRAAKKAILADVNARLKAVDEEQAPPQTPAKKPSRKAVAAKTETPAPKALTPVVAETKPALAPRPAGRVRSARKPKADAP